jgi:hypothetical protein
MANPLRKGLRPVGISVGTLAKAVRRNQSVQWLDNAHGFWRPTNTGSSRQHGLSARPVQLAILVEDCRFA